MKCADHFSDYTNHYTFKEITDPFHTPRIIELGCLDAPDLMVAGSVQKVEYRTSKGFFISQRLCFRERWLS